MSPQLQPWETKRFLELFTADPKFRKEVVDKPNQSITAYGITVTPSDIKELWEDAEQSLFESKSSISINYSNWCTQRRLNAHHWLDKLQRGTPTSFKNWRTRQSNRYAAQAADGFARRKRLLPFAIELSEGCSIGCRYCGLSAPPLKSVARYKNNSNEKVFKTIISSLKNYIGEAGACGFLYWATDPFDNPDYEIYLQTFKEYFGIPPQTTTAAWQKNLNRTRKFIELRQTMKGTWDRFSINSLEELRIVLDEFSPFDLKDIDLVLQNPESLKIKSCAGRAKNLASNTQLGSIACVSGFLINLSQRNIKLISPCVDFERWPQGYAIFAETNFDDSSQKLTEFFKFCEREIFCEKLEDNKILSLRGEINISHQSNNSIHLATRFANILIEDDIEQKVVTRVNGISTVSEIVSDICKKSHVNPGHVLHATHTLYKKGIFENLPLPNFSRNV